MENVPLRRLVAKLKVSKQSQSLSNTHNTDIHEETEPNSLYWIDEILNKLENNKVGTLATLLSLTIIHVAEIAQVDCYRAKVSFYILPLRFLIFTILLLLMMITMKRE